MKKEYDSFGFGFPISDFMKQNLVRLYCESMNSIPIKIENRPVVTKLIEEIDKHWNFIASLRGN